MRIHLNLKRKWFDMIKAGQKLEEYREIKEYWALRLLDFNEEQEYSVLCEMLHDMRKPSRQHSDIYELMKYFGVKFKQFDIVKFKNGCSSDAPQFDVRCSEITISKGREDWGAEPDKYYFVFKLGTI